MFSFFRHGTSVTLISLSLLRFRASTCSCGHLLTLNSLILFLDAFTAYSTGLPDRFRAVILLLETSTFFRAVKPDRLSVPARFLPLRSISVMCPFSTLMPGIALTLDTLTPNCAALVWPVADVCARNAPRLLTSFLLCANVSDTVSAAASNKTVLLITLLFFSDIQ